VQKGIKLLYNTRLSAQQLPEVKERKPSSKGLFRLCYFTLDSTLNRKYTIEPLLLLNSASPSTQRRTLASLALPPSVSLASARAVSAE
jgi:hypothetical protein